MKKKVLILFLLFFISFLFSEELKYNKILPLYLLDFTIDAGCGIYLGNFKEHLDKEGAYWATPVFDFYISFFIIKYFGIQVYIGNGSVIHPRSYPIEGTILYHALELFYQYEWKLIFIKIFSGAGFQHCTMLISYYASGFFEFGTGVGVKITYYINLLGSVKYKMGFLHSLLVLPENLISLTFSIGLIFRLPRSYILKN